MTKKSSTVSKTIKKLAAKEESAQIMVQVRQLAWTGQHAKAIELASQELSKSDWQSDASQADYQSALLDLRAESHLAQLNFEAAEKDVEQMERLAKAANKLGLKAQALIREAHLRAWQNRKEDTRRTAT